MKPTRPAGNENCCAKRLIIQSRRSHTVRELDLQRNQSDPSPLPDWVNTSDVTPFDLAREMPREASFRPGEEGDILLYLHDLENRHSTALPTLSI